jgi:hypothetical protein
MSMTKKWLIPLFICALAGTLFAQAPPDAKFYKLEFVVKEVEGSKTVNARSFVTMLTAQTGATSTIRVSGRVPVLVRAGTNDFNYLDTGVSIDAKDLRELQGELSLVISADISRVAQETQGTQPVVRHNGWAGAVLLSPKKPTVVFASDDTAAKTQLQLEVTATPVK